MTPCVKYIGKLRQTQQIKVKIYFGINPRRVKCIMLEIGLNKSMTSKFDPKQIELVIKGIYEGESVTKTLKKHGITKQTFYDALHENPLLEDYYIRAQQAQTEINLDEMRDVAFNESDAAKARNIIDVLKWTNERLNPKKFGARMDLNVNQTIDLKGALLEAKSRSMQVIDIQPKRLTNETDLESVADIKDSSDELDRMLGIGSFSEKDPAGGGGGGEK